VDVAEAPWRSALVRLLPEIEARLRERYPALAIERVQLMED
jgi:hypothetical protein